MTRHLPPQPSYLIMSLLSQEELSALQTALVAAERGVGQAAEEERQALRALDQAEVARERLASRLQELDKTEADLVQQKKLVLGELETAKAQRSNLPAPDTGRASLEASQAKHDAACSALQAATATLAAHDQALAVARERTAAQRGDMANWQARSGEAAQRLSDMARRFEEIEEERAVFAAKPEGLMREIEQGVTVRERLTRELAEAEAAVATAQEAAEGVDRTFTDANEALATARESCAGLAARAESEEARRAEMARVSGERFECPPPMLAGNFIFDVEQLSIQAASAYLETLSCF